MNDIIGAGLTRFPYPTWQNYGGIFRCQGVAMLGKDHTRIIASASWLSLADLDMDEVSLCIHTRGLGLHFPSRPNIRNSFLLIALDVDDYIGMTLLHDGNILLCKVFVDPKGHICLSRVSLRAVLGRISGEDPVRSRWSIIEAAYPATPTTRAHLKKFVVVQAVWNRALPGKPKWA